MNNEVFLWPKIFYVIHFTDGYKSQKESFLVEVSGATLTRDTCAGFFLFLFTQGPKTRIKNMVGYVSLVSFLLWMYMYLCTRMLLHEMYLDKSNYKIRFSLFFKLLMWLLVLLR